MDSRHQAAVSRGQEERHAVGHEDAASGGSAGYPRVQDERVRCRDPLRPGRGHDTGVDLIHPGQVLVPVEPEEILQPSAVTMNALRVVSDMESQIPSLEDARPAPVKAPSPCVTIMSAEGRDPLQAAGGEVPASTRTQIHLDQVRDLIRARLTHA
jgi:hypothetical protein